jgi:outer membrane protein
MPNQKWTLSECVNYALEHNISIKQTELDIKTSTIDKRGAVGSFLPSLNGNIAFLEWFKQDITTGLCKKSNDAVYFN